MQRVRSKMALDSNIAPLLAAQYSRSDSCDAGAGSRGILPTLANNAPRVERTQGTSRCHTDISILAKDALNTTAINTR